jgi:hypothetical protein
LREEKTMKLNSLFIAMDLLTLLAYTIVFVQGKLRQFSKPKDGIPLVNLLVTVPVASGR